MCGIQIRSKRLVWLIGIFAVSFLGDAFAGDWPQWRGPNRDGVVAELSLPSDWPAELSLEWRVEAGLGRSSPIVADGKIFLHHRRNDLEEVACLKLDDGEAMWRQTNTAIFTKNQYAQSQGDGPFSTPAYQARRVYTLGVNGLLSCFNSETGELIWRDSYTERVNTSKLFSGSSMSPILFEDLCIAHVGDDLNGALIACDAETGERRWLWDKQGPGYASPIIIEIEGARQLVTLTDKACIGVDPNSGKLLWEFPFPDEWNENIVTPVYHNGLLILSGVRKGTLALNISKKDDAWSTDTVWQNADLPMYMSSPVVHKNILFGLTNKRKGQFFAMNPKNGESYWTSEGRQGQNAAILASGNFLFLLSTEGQLYVSRATASSFTPVRKYVVSEAAVWAHPVLLEGGVLVKDHASLAFWSFATTNKKGSD
jgi:outer membrane protein assembly factor BamB